MNDCRWCGSRNRFHPGVVVRRNCPPEPEPPLSTPAVPPEALPPEAQEALPPVPPPPIAHTPFAHKPLLRAWPMPARAP